MSELFDAWSAAGAKEPHRRALVQAWLAGLELERVRERRTLPLSRSLAEALPRFQAELDLLVRPVSEHPSADGACRLLYRLGSGATVESVLLPREAVCVSTQVGCAVGCRFCKTGESGLLAQLTDAEILAQVALARRRRKTRRVVFMGMGEPAHNLEAVLEALAWLGTEGRFAHKDLVFSTVGDARAFERLAEHTVKPALALSLHTTRAELRAELLPRAPRIAPEELIELADRYARRVGHPVQYQWTLLEGVNDGDGELDLLVRLLRGRKGIVNFIPFNAVEGSGYRRTPIERCVAMVRHLKRNGVLATIRRSGGQDVEAACGQLRARAPGGARSFAQAAHRVPVARVQPL